MSNTVRSWLLLVVTLCLGIAIGVLSGGAINERRLRRLNDMRRPGGFIGHLQDVIKPTSDSQWTALRPIIEAYDVSNAARRRSHEMAMRASLDSLKAQLEPMLDPAQRERLMRFAPGRPPLRGGRGPRGGGPDRGGPPHRNGPPFDAPPPPPPPR